MIHDVLRAYLDNVMEVLNLYRDGLPETDDRTRADHPVRRILSTREALWKALEWDSSEPNDSFVVKISLFHIFFSKTKEARPQLMEALGRYDPAIRDMIVDYRARMAEFKLDGEDGTS